MKHDRPSSTAVLVALGTLYLSLQPGGERLVAPDASAALRAGFERLGGFPRRAARAADTAFGAWCSRVWQACTVPGVMSHLGLRKRMIEHLARAGVKAGYRRLVVVAAGLDLLAWRMSRAEPALRAVEIDHPSTQLAKRTFLGAQSDVSLVSADLSRVKVSEVLGKEDVPTVFVIEGLTMYLRREDVEALWKDLASGPGPRRMICTFMEPGEDGRASFPRQSPLLAPLLALTGEPFHWGARVSEVGELLAQCGWKLSGVIGPAEFTALAEEAGPPFTVDQPVGEYILIADKA